MFVVIRRILLAYLERILLLLSFKIGKILGCPRIYTYQLYRGIPAQMDNYFLSSRRLYTLASTQSPFWNPCVQQISSIARQLEFVGRPILSAEKTTSLRDRFEQFSLWAFLNSLSYERPLLTFLYNFDSECVIIRLYALAACTLMAFCEEPIPNRVSKVEVGVDINTPQFSHFFQHHLCHLFFILIPRTTTLYTLYLISWKTYRRVQIVHF